MHVMNNLIAHWHSFTKMPMQRFDELLTAFKFFNAFYLSSMSSKEGKWVFIADVFLCHKPEGTFPGRKSTSHFCIPNRVEADDKDLACQDILQNTFQPLYRVKVEV